MAKLAISNDPLRVPRLLINCLVGNFQVLLKAVLGYCCLLLPLILSRSCDCLGSEGNFISMQLGGLLHCMWDVLGMLSG